MNPPFSVGARVELRFCPGPAGTVTALIRGRVQVLFDDFRDQPPKAFRPESLHLAKRELPQKNVPEPVASGTGKDGCSSTRNQSFGVPREKSFLEPLQIAGRVDQAPQKGGFV
jgi:hypothetical protein